MDIYEMSSIRRDAARHLAFFGMELYTRKVVLEGEHLPFLPTNPIHNEEGVVMKTAGLLLSAAIVLSACASTQPSPDAQLANRVKQDITQTQGIGGAGSVNVEAARGTVVLSGFIGSEQQRQDAGQAALKVDGVQQVFNNIKVNGQSSS